MKLSDALKRGLRDVRKAMQAQQFAAALDRVDALLKAYPTCSPLFVLRGRLIQLQDESGPELVEAKRSFQQALEFDEHSLDAWLERAHFEFAVQDDATSAQDSFAQAEALARTALIDALVGRAATLTELERGDEAFHCLAAARWLQTLALQRPAKTSPDHVLDQFESLLSSR